MEKVFSTSSVLYGLFSLRLKVGMLVELSGRAQRQKSIP